MSKKAQPLPALTVLNALFSYNPETGHLMRRKPYRGKWRADQVHSGGYWQVTVAGKQYLSHRVIWKMQTGDEPPEIDHRDTDRSNNIWDNLRADSGIGNRRNKALTIQNTSGLKGASFHKKYGRWRATIKSGGAQIFLGWFDSKELAHAAYCDAAARMHGQFHNLGHKS